MEKGAPPHEFIDLYIFISKGHQPLVRGIKSAFFKNSIGTFYLIFKQCTLTCPLNFY